MPWEWKEDVAPPPVQPVYYPGFYASVSELVKLIWLFVVCSIAVTVGFCLLIGTTLSVVNDNDAGLANDVLGYSVAVWLGSVLVIVGCITSFVTGIMMLCKRWAPDMVNERGLVVAAGIISILGTLTVVGIILGSILLNRLANYKRVPPPVMVPPAPPTSIA